MSDRSFCATTRGFDPFWIAAIPSMVSSIRAASSSLSRFRRLPRGRKMRFAEATPHRVARKAAAIRWPSSSGWERFSSTCTSPITVPMMPIVGA